MDISFYSFSEPLNRGIDFYTPDEGTNISVSISITSSLGVNFTMPIRANLSANSNVLVVGTRIIHAVSSINIDGATLALAEGIKKASISISGSVNLNTLIRKDALASSLISSNASVNINAHRELYGNSAIDINSNMTVSAGELVHAISNITSNSNLAASITRIRLSSAVIGVESNVDINGLRIAIVSTSIEAGITSFTVAAQRITEAQILIDVSSNIIATMRKNSFAASIITPSSTVNTIARKIKFASSIINSNVNLIVIGKIVLITARINQLFNNTDITVQAIKFSNTVVHATTVDFSSIRSLLMLDGVPLTNQNRKLDVSAAPIFIENLNWQGDASRYYKNASANSATKRTFNLQWTFIPNFENKTVDLRASRNFLNKKSKDGDVHTLTILKQDENGTTPYAEENVDVLIVNYSENLIRRDLVDNVYYFDCSMSLQEV
jgi:hypothetical protein